MCEGDPRRCRPRRGVRVPMSRRHHRTTNHGRHRGVASQPSPASEPKVAETPLTASPERSVRLAGTASALPAPVASIFTTVPVAGMTCRSCELRIQRHVGRIPNVQRVMASAPRGRVVVESSGPVSATAIAKAINAAGYEVGETRWIERDPRAWLDAGTGLLLLAAIAVVAQVTGLTGLASGAGDLSSGGLVGGT